MDLMLAFTVFGFCTVIVTGVRTSRRLPLFILKMATTTRSYTSSPPTRPWIERAGGIKGIKQRRVNDGALRQAAGEGFA